MLVEEKYNYKNIKPFKYSSREVYRIKETTVDFWVMIATIMLTISILTTMSLTFLTLSKNSPLALIIFLISLIVWFPILGCIMWLRESEYGVRDFIDECIERYKMRKRPNYIPIEYSAVTELNRVIQLENEELYRVYQFINAEKSDTQTIALELPKYTMSVTSERKEMCMFKALNDKEIADILIPIRQYYVDKLYREKMQQKEAETKRQSEVNSRITNKDINNLPLFKSMQSLVDKTEEDVKKHHKETQFHLKENQDIVDKVNETIKNKR